MPDSWKRTRTQVPGAVHANYWHGVLEVYNGDGMRWATPYPESRNDTYRVMVVGDSLTYGDGLAEQWRFSNLLEQSMGAKFKIEFLNLGRDGAQSEDILWVVRRHLPLLKPNLVIYAVCLNDFLPSGRGQYHSLSAYPFPLPDRVKNFFIHKTRTGAFLNENYDGALRALHLRADFFDDILADFQGYQRRFARDVAQMNASVLEAGLPPMISLVLDQYPSYGSVGYRIAMVAERLLAAGGAMVVPTEDFFRRFNGQAMHISRWEGHPNEVANIIWANMIAKVLRDRPDLQPFKR
jgi:lysophospholipase L1-like esterase